MSRKEMSRRLELRALRVRIQLFRVAYADMSVKAQEALIAASELGLRDEAFSDMFGTGEHDNGSFKGATEKIQALIDAEDRKL